MTDSTSDDLDPEHIQEVFETLDRQTRELDAVLEGEDDTEEDLFNLKTGESKVTEVERQDPIYEFDVFVVEGTPLVPTEDVTEYITSRNEQIDEITEMIREVGSKAKKKREQAQKRREERREEIREINEMVDEMDEIIDERYGGDGE